MGHDKIAIQDSLLKKVTKFLVGIGIEYCYTDEEFDSFLPGVRIEHGSLKINSNKLICIGDILHEAGHLACLPSNLRKKADDNIGESLGDEHTYELGVIAWSVAAALHLEIPLSEIFHTNGYKGDAKWLRDQYATKNYLGLPLLQWMEMAAFDDEIDGDTVLPYPKMIRWTRI